MIQAQTEADEFAGLVAEMVEEEAPRLFAVVWEYGEPLDGAIAAWGLAFDGHAEVLALGRGSWFRLRSPQDALRFFAAGPDVRARLVWPGAGPDGGSAGGEQEL